MRANFRLPLILAVISVVELTQFLKTDHHTGTVFAAFAGSLALAAITGAICAMTVRVWIQAGHALRQGPGSPPRCGSSRWACTSATTNWSTARARSPAWARRR